MARVCLWLATCALTAQAIDLAALRRDTPASAIPMPTQLYTHFTEPLAPADFLPLCGNGRIDTATDYAQHYASHPSWFVLWRALQLPLWRALMLSYSSPFGAR